MAKAGIFIFSYISYNMIIFNLSIFYMNKLYTHQHTHTLRVYNKYDEQSQSKALICYNKYVNNCLEKKKRKLKREKKKISQKQNNIWKKLKRRKRRRSCVNAQTHTPHSQR